MGDPILLIFSPEFLKIFLSEKTLFRESMGVFQEMTHIWFCILEREGEKEFGVGDYRGRWN